MAADAKFAIKDAVGKQLLSPVTVSEELEQKFVKKARSSSIKLVPISIIVSVVILTIAVLLVIFLNRVVFSAIGIIAVFFPFYAIYDMFATGKALKNHDYEFLTGEVIGKTDNGNYIIRGLEGLPIAIMFGKKEYNPGETAIVARVKDDLNLISEE